MMVNKPSFYENKINMNFSLYMIKLTKTFKIKYKTIISSCWFL